MARHYFTTRHSRHIWIPLVVHDPIEGLIIGQMPCFLLFLHEIKGKGGCSTGNQGDCVVDGTIGKGGRFCDCLARYGLRATQIPWAGIPCLWIGQAEIENPFDSMPDLLASVPGKEIDLIE